MFTEDKTIHQNLVSFRVKRINSEKLASKTNKTDPEIQDRETFLNQNNQPQFTKMFTTQSFQH